MNPNRPPAPDAESRLGSRRSGPSRPPYNPGLQKLVEGKKAWAEPLSAEAKARGFLGWHQRGYLPHCDFPGVTQFVTLRLADSMPASRRGEWEALLHLEDNKERRIKLEEYLDRGLGECQLRQPAMAELADNTLRHFDGQRYRLQAWVIMPNHIHVLVDIWQTPLTKLDKSWKQFIARQANRLLDRKGELWEREYWDTVMDDDDHRRKSVHYIEANPVKAGFVCEPQAWPWSSARFRDKYGRLPEPPNPGAPVSQPA
jgi:REP element-mobilizing transposase RayT